MEETAGDPEVIKEGESVHEYLHRTSTRRALTGVYIVWLRDFKRFWRDTPRRVGAFFQPLIYLFLLGTGLQSAFKVFGGANTKYVLFMFPGILGMTILFTAVFSSISILWDREFGFLKEVLVSPVPRSSVAIGKIFGGATTAMIQGIILMILMFFPFMFGFSLTTLWKAIALIPLAILLSIGLTSLGVAIAARMKSMEGFPIVMNFILLPLFFLSGAMFPLEGLPPWMTFLTKINPLAYGVDMLRGVTLHGVTIVSPSGSSAASKVPPAVLSQMTPAVKAWLAKTVAAATPHLATQRYPMWLDITVIIGFSAAMLALAIWQFGLQE